MKKIVVLIFVIFAFLQSNVYASEDVLPHYDDNGKPYVTYEDFGAKCDGEYDDFLAITEAHKYANSHDYEVKASAGKTYHIWGLEAKSVNISTNVDWNNANFIIHDEEIQNYDAKSRYLFTVCKQPKETIIENPDWTIGKSTKQIPEITKILKNENYKNFFCVAENSSKKQYIRFGADANNGDIQQDYFIVDSKGNVKNGIRWDFEKITKFKIFPMIEDGLEIKNGNFKTNSNSTINPSGKYFLRNICILNTANVTISGITHTSSDKDAPNSAYFGFIFSKNSSNLTIKNCDLLTRKEVSGRSTYDLVIDNSVNVRCENITSNDIHDEDRWGIVQTAYSKDVVFENCKLNRIDAHQGIYNLTVKNCDIGFRGLTLIGQGEANIINTTVTATAFIDLRYDYGSTWDGKINVVDCTYKYQGQYAPKLFNFKFQYDDTENKVLHDFGYECKFPNVYFENLNIDFQNAGSQKQVYVIPNFEAMLGSHYNGNSAYWPDYIHINGYKFINNPNNADIKLSYQTLDTDPNKVYEYVITKSITEAGDIDRNGKIDINDLAVLKLYLIGKKALSVEKLADIDEDNKVSINDLARLKLLLISGEIRASSVEKMKSISILKEGDIVQTDGYYFASDGGDAKYLVVKNSSDITVNNGNYIKLDNGLIAKLVVENDTANIKQFGAKGDGKTNDADSIENALNSEIANIEFKQGEYKITRFINLTKGNVNVLGNDSIIFTDDDYKPSKYSEFLIVIKGNNYKFKNLKIEARETKKLENLYISQVYVGSSNIEFNSCDFYVPETVSNKHQYNNIDLYTNWHNVLIENCNLYLAHDGSAGGCIWVRDFYNRGASDLIFKNNTCYKKCHDEILAIFSGTVENVEISNNKFVMPESTDPSVMCFTIGSESSKKADNIKFENNEINCVSKMELFMLNNSSNVLIKNNNINYTKQNIEFNNYLINSKSSVSNLDVIDNKIEYNNNSLQAINAIIYSASQDVDFLSNTIVINSGIKEAFNEGMNISGNTVTFNGSVHVIANKPREFNNNKIILNGKTDSFFQYFKGNLNWESNIVSNTIENNFDEVTADHQSVILLFNGVTLNSSDVNLEKNIVKGENINSGSRLYLVTLEDEVPQTIKITENNITGYVKKVEYKNKVKHNITIME